MNDKIRLVCTNCQTINQFPHQKVVENPKCAKCQNDLITGSPIEASSAQLSRHIQQSGLPVLVDFWAPWCGPCLAFAPTFSQYAEQKKHQLRLLKVNTEVEQQAGAQFNIRSIPTLALFQQGKEVARISGAMNLPQLDQWVGQSLRTM